MGIYFIKNKWCIKMDEKDVLQDLASAIDQSQHKSLLLSGLSVFSGLLKGEEVDLSVMNDPIKDSIKVLAEDIDREFSTEVAVPENSRALTFKRYAGKCVKKELLKSVGENLSPEEKEQYDSDKREIFELIFDYL